MAAGFVGADDDKGGTTGKKRGHNWLIGHDLFIWSPKGFLTGSGTTPGSILLGTHFERNDASCTNAERCSSINGGQFHRETLLLREWDIYYFIAPRIGVSPTVLWYDAEPAHGRTRLVRIWGYFQPDALRAVVARAATGPICRWTGDGISRVINHVFD
jgi:hypothetical protein